MRYLLLTLLLCGCTATFNPVVDIDCSDYLITDEGIIYYRDNRKIGIPHYSSTHFYCSKRSIVK